MPHEEQRLVWHLEGRQDFTVRGSKSGDIPAGVTIVSITEITLRRLTAPDVWTSTTLVGMSQAIIADDFDPENPQAGAAIYWEAERDVDGDPVKGGEYDWLVIGRLSNGLDFVSKPRVDLVP